MRELGIAFNKGRDEAAQALRPFPDGLPISRVEHPIETDQPILSEEARANLAEYFKSFGRDESSGSPDNGKQQSMDAANLHIQKEVER